MNPFPYCLMAYENRGNFLAGEKLITVYINPSQVICVKFVEYDERDYAVVVMNNYLLLFITYDTAENLVKWMRAKSTLPSKVQVQEVIVTE